MNTTTPTAADLARDTYIAAPNTITLDTRPDGITTLADGDRRLVIGDEHDDIPDEYGDELPPWGWTWTTYVRATDPYDGEFWEEMNTTSHPITEEDQARAELLEWANGEV